MHSPVTLVDMAIIAVAAGCARSTCIDLSSVPRSLWRLAPAPVLAVGAALVSLAGAVETVEQDATRVAMALLLGAAFGVVRGRRIPVETDQVRGLVRTPATPDSVVAGLAIMAIAVVDGLSGLFRPAIPHIDMAAAATFLASYLLGRTWAIAARAVESPHTEMSTEDA